MEVKKTFHGHLVKMTKANFIQYEKRGRKHYYSLTEHTKRRLEFEIKEYVKPKRRNLKYKKQIPKYDKKKLYALFLLQSGAGSTQIISSSSTKNQDLNESLMMIDPRYLNNNNRIKYHRQEKQKNHKRYIDVNGLKKIHGVTIEDINFRRNVAYKGIFSHIEFSKTDIEDTFKKIKDLGIGEKIIKLYTREGQEQQQQEKNQQEFAIEITDDYLRQFISCLGAILDIVEYRIRYSWIFNQQEPRRNSIEFQWYKDLFGTHRTVDVLIKGSNFKDFLKDISKERREKLQNQARMDLFNLDKTIVGLYYSFIKCSKLDLKFIRNREEISNYIEYKKYIKKIPKKVFELLSILIDICYPKFLRNKYSKEITIRKYIHDLEQLHPSTNLNLLK